MNPGFEIGTSKWGFMRATLTLDDSAPLMGVCSGRGVVNSEGYFPRLVHVVEGLEIGETYRASVWIRTDGSKGPRLALSEPGLWTSSSVQGVQNGLWQKLEITSRALETTKLELWCGLPDSAVLGTVFWVDEVLVTLADPG